MTGRRVHHHHHACDAALRQGASRFSPATCTQSVVVRECLLARIQKALAHRKTGATIDNMTHDVPMAYLAALGYNCIKHTLNEPPSSGVANAFNKRIRHRNTRLSPETLADVIFFEDVYAALPHAVHFWANDRLLNRRTRLREYFSSLYPETTTRTLTRLRDAARKRFPGEVITPVVGGVRNRQQT